MPNALVTKALDNIQTKNLDEMRNNLNAALTSKAVEKLNEKKQHIAKNYFAQKTK